MTQRLLLACALASAVLAPTTRAQDAISDHIGLVGIGFFSPAAPIGIRYWSGPSTGFDLGFGFNSSSGHAIVENEEVSTTSLVSFGVESGYLRVISSDTNMLTFFRPGIGFFGEQVIVPVARGGLADTKKETETTLNVSLTLGVELFLTKLGFGNLSFSGAVGAAFTRTSPAGGGDAVTSFGTYRTDISIVENAALGFHFYF